MLVGWPGAEFDLSTVSCHIKMFSCPLAVDLGGIGLANLWEQVVFKIVVKPGYRYNLTIWCQNGHWIA